MEPDEDAAQEQLQQPQTHSQGVLPLQPPQEYHYRPASEATVSTQAQHTPVGAIAEFVCATKAAGTTPAYAVPLTVRVQLFEKECARWQPRPRAVLLFSWRCPGEAEHGPMHEVGAVASQPAVTGWPGVHSDRPSRVALGSKH